MTATQRKKRKSRLMKLLIVSAPVAACAFAAAEAVLPGMHDVMSPWAYAGASVVVSTLARVLTHHAFADPAPDPSEAPGA